ncbi:MAG: peptidylprolyl isomerase [Gammaproteobacteria bacterium]|nr:peptidylprolyl isomerase [Gammaproteobacteria bacterium]
MKASVSKNLTAKLLYTAVFSGLLLTNTALMAEEDKVIATVNADAITESQLEIAATQSKVNYKEITPDQKKLLTEALINRQLVLSEAIKAQFDKTPDIAARVKALTDSYVAANYLATIAKEFKIDEAAMKAYYDKNVVGNTPNEFKARHILVKTEDEAKALIKEIEGGADFSALAKEKSTDTGSGSRGGDLGWFTEQDMVAPFSKKVASLKKGELSKTPVNSQFGWHVIILDDTRKTTPPEFNAVKQNIEKVLIKEQLNQYLDDLNTKATIKIK